MANPSVIKTPNDYELANGDVVVSLYDLDEDGGQLAIQIIEGINVISTIRQYPNLVGYYHFNINKILQSQMALQLNPEGQSPSLPLNIGNDTTFDYRISYGYINATGVYVPSSTLATVFIGINGTKLYWETDWDISNTADGLALIPDVSDVAGVNTTNTFQVASTDNHIRPTRLGSTITDGKPTWLTNSMVVRDIYINEQDYYNLSFVNGWTGTPIASYNGINGFFFDAYNSAGTSILNTETNNLISQGGGPNVLFNDETAPTGDYRMIGAKCGYNVSNISALTGLNHYYVAAWAWSVDPDVYNNKTVISEVYRFNILPCEGKDYPIIDVAWINSYGQYDYFSFQKRSVETNNMSRTEYQGVPPSWSGTTVDVNTWDRGKGVFATKVEENYTATTRYIDEYDSEFLKYLYRSPEVMVRFAGNTTWTPVVLTSNTWDEKTPQNQGKQLFQHSISFKTAWNPQIQNG